MSESLTIDFAESFPLFPLPSCVLLPHATIPLHIFEPRYQEMITDALASRRMIAMASFEGEKWKQNYEGSPPIRPYVCLGLIVRHERFPDGRFNILLQGVCRARLIREVEDMTAYRQAMLEPIDVLQTTMEIDLADQRERIESLLKDETLRELAGVSAIHQWISADIPTVALVDLTAMTICDDAEQRYNLLSEPNANARAEWLESYLRSTRKTLATANHFAPPDLPDEINLN